MRRVAGGGTGDAGNRLICVVATRKKGKWGEGTMGRGGKGKNKKANKAGISTADRSNKWGVWDLRGKRKGSINCGKKEKTEKP